MIYFDHAATTATIKAAAEAALHAMCVDFGNPSSGHHLGRAAAASLAEQRRSIATALDARTEELYFTSGGTEGNNWAISLAMQHNRRLGRHIITSNAEHAAVLAPIRALERDGFAVTYLPVDKNGRISTEQVEAALRDDTALVSLMLVNNETGVISPIAEIAAMLRRRKSAALLHSDAVQAFLHIPLSVRDLGVDILTVSAHKVGGVKGSGALYVKAGLSPSPLLRGGGQEFGHRSGTEATAQIAAFAAAVAQGQAQLLPDGAAIAALKHYALDALRACIPALVVISAGDAPHICSIALPGYPSEMLLRSLSDLEIFVSSGSACHKGKPSHVFSAMKLAPRVAKSALRLSFAASNTCAEVDSLCAALADICATRVAAKH